MSTAFSFASSRPTVDPMSNWFIWTLCGQGELLKQWSALGWVVLGHHYLNSSSAVKWRASSYGAVL